MRPSVDRRRAVAIALAIVLASGAAMAGATARGAEPVTLIRASRVYPIASAPIEGGRIVLRGGKVVEVGASVSVTGVEPGVRLIDVRGSVIPGLIDCASTLGIEGRPADEFNELTPEIEALGGVDLGSDGFQRALEEGVTAVALTPGPRNVVGGRGAVVRTGPRRGGLEVRVVKADAFLEASLDEEASAGNFNLRFGRPFSYTFRIPNTRMGTVFLLRRALFEVEEKPERSELPDLLTEAGKAQLRRALDGALPLRIHADDRQEILAALRLAEEFRARLIVVGGSEAWDLAPILARQHAGIVLPAAGSPREMQIESYPDYSARLPGHLAALGATFAFGSGDAGGARRLRSRVALGLRYGLPEAAALEALTLGAARLLGVDAELGTIEPGKAADLVAIAGDPLDPAAPVRWVMIRGEILAGEMERKL